MSQRDTNAYLTRRTAVIFRQYLESVLIDTSRLFVILFCIQWIAGVIAAVVITPRTWVGSESSIHLHLKAAIFLGFAINTLPVLLALTRPTAAVTRHVVAVSQMLWSALLVGLTGGRIETHFHVFGSLAFLAFYRDWKVLVTATVIVSADHFIRGVVWPESVYGVLYASPWRTVEHAAWVIFENIFLSYKCVRSMRELHLISARQASVESMNKDFERKIAEEIVLRKDLQEAVEEAEAASAAKSAFLANMSHEIRTPLNGIQGSLTLLGQAGLDSQFRHFLKIGTRSCDMLSSLINDVLDFSKIEAGMLELDDAFYDLREVVERVVEALFLRSSEKSLILASFVAPGVPERVKGDALRLGQILLNLVNNAVKFTHRGHVVVTVAGHDDGPSRYRLRFEVQDTGIGIPAEKLTSLFDPFTQADVSTTKRFGGTGLGLTICRELVQRMGGEIGVNSEPGKGSVFWFTLSVEFEAPERSTNRYFSLDKTRVRLLLLGEDTEYQKILARQLGSWGFASECLADCFRLCDIVTEARNQDRPFTAVLVTTALQDAVADSLRTLASSAPSPPPVAILTGSSESTENALLGDDARIRRIVRPFHQSNMCDSLLTLLRPETPGTHVSAPTSSALGQLSKEAFTAARVLLAEDNEVNQIIATEFLRLHKIAPTVVSNGAQAVDAFNTGAFDLVLLDCHMPEMDGFEAARRMRMHESDCKSVAVPIVALSADVTIEAQQRCTEVGFTAYISKPLDPGKLAEILRRYLSSQPISSAQTLSHQDQNVRANGPHGPIDLRDLSSRFENNQALVRMVLDRFQAQLQEDVPALESSVRATDADSVFTLSHRLKGAAGAAGARTLADVLRGLEGVAKSKEWSRAAPLVLALREEASMCLEYLSHGINDGVAREKESSCG